MTRWRVAICLAVGLAILSSFQPLSAASIPVRDADAGPPARELAWRPCPDAGAPVECALLAVPLDHAHPAGRSIRLPVRRISARDPGNRIGVLVTIAGGPGQRGTDLVVPGVHAAAIERSFDIVSWDPRGTSGETLIDCIPVWDPYDGIDRTPDTVDERKTLDARTAALAATCRQRHAPLLPHVGTVDAARDLERLRLALGEPRINLLGTSYGAEVAIVYSALHPEQVRAAVLDGFSDPFRSPGERDVEQAAAFERELDRLIADCAVDATCPLHTDGDPGGALDSLIGRLDAAQTSSLDGGGAATQSDAYEAILGSLLRDDAARERLLHALADAADGDGADLRSIAEESRSAFEVSGLTLGVFAAITCADDAAWWRSLDAADVDRLDRSFGAAAPRLGPWFWTPGTDAAGSLVGLCAMTPADQPPSSIRQLSRSEIDESGPILVLGTTGDPTTPVAAAERATRDIESARLLSIEADHHTAYGFAVQAPDRPIHRCVLSAVEDVLFRLEIPVAGATCG